MQAAASSVIRSPAITAGTAGGHPADASARTRPIASSTAISREGDSIASRMLILRSGIGIGGTWQCSASRRGMLRSAVSSRCHSRSVVSADGIITSYSRSANSHSIPSRLSSCASSVPV